MSKMLRLTKEILGRSNPGTPPMDLLEKVNAVGDVAAVFALTYYAYQTFPFLGPIYKLRQEQERLHAAIREVDLEDRESKANEKSTTSI